MQETDRARLRKTLSSGNAAEADKAMSILLDVAEEEMLDPRDLGLALDSMERLGKPGQAKMFQSFILFAARFPRASAPTLIEEINRSPLSWSGRLSMSVLVEIIRYSPEWSKQIDRQAVEAAMMKAIDYAGDTGTDEASEAIEVLHLLGTPAHLPSAGESMVKFLMKAADEPSPKINSLLRIRETLEANGQGALLEQVVARSKALSADHPLRLAFIPNT